MRMPAPPAPQRVCRGMLVPASCVLCCCSPAHPPHPRRFLLETGQEEKAGLVKEREGDYLGAIALYLKGGLPARAAQVVVTYGQSHDRALLDSILASLGKAGLYERAGELHEYLGRSEEAMQAYRRGHAYRWEGSGGVGVGGAEGGGLRGKRLRVRRSGWHCCVGGGSAAAGCPSYA